MKSDDEKQSAVATLETTGTLPSEASVDEQARAFRARSLEYLQLGYDRVKAARFVVETAGALHGPALDVGTGKGLLATELARRGLEVVSIDVNDGERELARLLAEEAGLGGHVVLLHGDAARLSYPEETFGCVAMMDVMHHLVEPEQVLREMARVVRAGGAIVIADFDETGFELVSRLHRRTGREHPRTAATVSLAREVLSREGLRCTTRASGHLHDVVVLVKP